MNQILHITRRQLWLEASRLGTYRADTLDTEGFIHCSTPQQAVRVANARFRGERGLVLLQIDPARVLPEIRYEEAETGERFPHIFGPLNADAVIDVVPFEPGPDGIFVIPTGLGS